MTKKLNQSQKAFDENLDENIYQDVALGLLAVFKGKMPNDESISGTANGLEINADLLTDAVRREFDNLQQIKNALDDNKESEPQSITRDQVAFEEIHRFLYEMMSSAIEMSGGCLESLPLIEEKLTPHEFITIEAFYRWIGRAHKGLGISEFYAVEDYNERYKEWLATLEVKNEFKTNAS